VSRNLCSYINYEGGDHYTADQGCVWLLAAGLGPWAQAYRMAYRLSARSVCDSSIL